MYVYILIHVYVYTYICIYIYMMIYIPQDVLPMTGDAWASISEEAKDFISNCLTVDVLRRATLAKCVMCVAVWQSGVQRGACCCSALLQLVWFMHCLDCRHAVAGHIWKSACVYCSMFLKDRKTCLNQLVAAVPCRRRVVASHICKRVLLCVAMGYCVLQFVVEVPRRRQAMAGHVCKSSSVCCSLLQRVAACCSFLMQCFTVDVLRRATLSKCVAVWCSVFFQLDAYIYICTNGRKHECFSDLCCAKYTYICMYIYMHIYIHMCMNT